MKLIYEVQKGDTLCNISRKFFTTCDKLIELNQLTNSDYLKQGDLIIIRYIDDNKYMDTIIILEKIYKMIEEHNNSEYYDDYETCRGLIDDIFEIIKGVRNGNSNK